MIEFQCRLASTTGEITEAIYVAETESRLRHELEAKGLYVLSCRQKGALGRLPFQLPTRRRIATREFLVFNQELATLLKAGMPLVQSLDILRQRLPNPAFKAVLDDVHERVKSGSSLSDAFSAQGDQFPRIYTASLVAGEKSGGLEQVLRRYVAYVKVITAVRRKTLAALIYPLVLTLLSGGLVGVIVFKVIPAFQGFYDTFDAELPLLTRVIVGGATFIRTAAPIALLGLAVFLLVGWRWLTSPAQLTRYDRLLLALPVGGAVARKFATAQLARTLATLLGGGIPLVNAIEVGAKSVSNRYMAQQLLEISQRVREGESLSGSLQTRRIVPDVAIKMVEVGESTGALQDMLNSVADFYDEEVETELSRFVALIEPLLLVIMGLVVGVLLLSLYLPLFQLMSVVGG